MCVNGTTHDLNMGRIFMEMNNQIEEFVRQYNVI